MEPIMVTETPLLLKTRLHVGLLQLMPAPPRRMARRGDSGNSLLNRIQMQCCRGSPRPELINNQGLSLSASIFFQGTHHQG